MQFTTRSSGPIRAGRVTVSFRDWRRPHAKPGGIYRLRPSGAVRVTAIATVRLAEISAADAKRAGFDAPADIAAALGLPPTAMATRVAFELVAEPALPAPLPAAAVVAKLQTTDRRSGQPWTAAALALIRTREGTRAADLAPLLGLPTPEFKAKVRRLKSLGLTQSLAVGYRLTPLGREVAAVLAPASERW